MTNTYIKILLYSLLSTHLQLKYLSNAQYFKVILIHYG